MLPAQTVAERDQFLPQALRRVVAVVEMDLDLAEPLSAEVGKTVQAPGIVFLLRVEAGVPGGTSVGVAEIADRLRIPLAPVGHITARVGGSDPTAAKGLEVVGHTEDQPSGPGRPPSAKDRSEIAGKPFVCGTEHEW
jgi:hypothetical protein